jgi:hypothetical protein
MDKEKYFSVIVGIAAFSIETHSRHGLTWHSLFALWIGVSVGFALGAIK